MTKSPPLKASLLFETTRLHIRTVVSGSYLTFIGVHWLWGGSNSILDAGGPYLAAVLAGITLLTVIFGKKYSWYFSLLAHYVGFSVTLMVAWEQMQSYGPFSADLFWSVVLFFAHPMAVGARLGALGNMVTLGTMLCLVLMQPAWPKPLLENWLTGLTVLGTCGVLSYLMVDFIERNVMLNEEATTRLQAARRDKLTGMLGREAIEEEMTKWLLEAARNRSAMSLIMADIDHFKQVNDQHGHGTGDDVLKVFAKRLRRGVGSSGVVGRWGGEEFVIVLPGLSRPDALALAETLRRDIETVPIAGLSVTASFGVSSVRHPFDTADFLFSRADERLYEAKEAGRNGVR